MALSKKQVIDKIEVLENGVIQVRQATTVIEDEVELSKTFHRWVYAPDSDISEQPANVQAIAKATWTQDVIDAFNKQKAEDAALENTLRK